MISLALHVRVCVGLCLDLVTDWLLVVFIVLLCWYVVVCGVLFCFVELVMCLGFCGVVLLVEFGGFLL